MKTHTVVLLFLLSGCAPTAEVMVGAPVANGGFYGSGPTATIRLRQQLGGSTWCEYEHISYILKGPPFGPRNEEDSLDQIGCGIRFGGE